MLDYRRMLMEDFSLSPEIILGCRTEIEHHCSGLHRKGRTLHCLMKVVRGEKGNLGDSCQHSVSFVWLGGEGQSSSTVSSPARARLVLAECYHLGHILSGLCAQSSGLFGRNPAP